MPAVKRYAIVGLWLCAAPLYAAESEPEPLLSLNAVPVCYNFDCNIRDVIAIPESEWKMVDDWFRVPAKSAAEERDNIRQGIAWMMIIVGRHTPTHLDAPLDDLLPSDAPGQMDCIDHAINTTTYLRLLEKYGLLKWHRVLDRAYRRAVFDQHWAGQIEEIKTGERYVVDSWFAHFGTMPFIQKTKVWGYVPIFGTSLNDTSDD